MRNVLSIDTTKHCNCDCVSSIDDKTNLIVLAIKVGDVENPTVHVYVDDYNTENAPLMKNVENIFLLPYEHFTTASTIKVVYEDSTHRSDVFTFKFGDNRTGEMMVHMIDNFNYNVTFKQAGTGGGSSAYELSPATTNRLGGVIVGDNLTVDEIGKISADKQTDNNYTDTEKAKLEGIEANANNYELPPATRELLGGIIAGSGFDIDTNGKLSINVVGGGIERTTLWEGTVANEGDSGVCSQSIENFDFLLTYGMPLDVSTERHLQLLSVDEIKKNYGVANFSYEYYNEVYIRCRFTDNKNFECIQTGSEYITQYGYTKIEGIKLLKPSDLVKTITYTGNGNYGTNNPTELKFDYAPNVVFISGCGESNNLVETKIVKGQEKYLFFWYGNTDGHNVGDLAWSNNGKTLKLISGIDAGAQFNTKDETFTVVYM